MENGQMWSMDKVTPCPTKLIPVKVPSEETTDIYPGNKVMGTMLGRRNVRKPVWQADYHMSIT